MKDAADLEDGSRKANKKTIRGMTDTKDAYSVQCELKTTKKECSGFLSAIAHRGKWKG